MIANNGNCILIGQAASNNNSFQLQYNHVGLGSTNNYMWLVPFGNMNTGGTLYMNAYGNVGIGITNPAYKLDVNGSARISGVICSSTSAVTINGTFSNIFQYAAGRCYLLTLGDGGPDGTYGVYILFPTQNVISAIAGGGNYTLQYSGEYVQAKSNNLQSYPRTANIIQLS